MFATDNIQISLTGTRQNYRRILRNSEVIAMFAMLNTGLKICVVTNV
jgi:hypothetical protein